MVRTLINKLFARHKKTRKKGLISRFLGFVALLVIFSEKFGLQFMLDSAVVQAIRVYQKDLSPHKGFSCAYGRLHKGDSCSEYFGKTVRRYGLKEAIPLFQKRLRECKRAHIDLKARCRCGEKHYEVQMKKSSLLSDGSIT
jgi:putative component of membrane protein insertase Oxa1/YidC/SpoIIIJ protein YidD